MAPSYWLVGNRECKTDRWPAMHAGGFISIGWARVGNLARFENVRDNDTQEALAQAIYDAYRSIGKALDTARRDAGQVVSFLLKMEPGDRVVTVQKRRIVGVGVIQGSYAYDQGDTGQPNHRRVARARHDEPEWPDPLPIRHKVVRLTGERYGQLIRTIESVVATGLTGARHALDHEIAQQAGLADEQGVFDPLSIEDARRSVLRSVALRRGQSDFRAGLLDAYGGRCAVTGCAVEDVLEAAHTIPYRDEQTNDVSNGLLLRADIHTLFDLCLIAIDTKAMTVLVSDRLAGSDYQALAGVMLRLPASPRQHPNQDALLRHREDCGF